MVDDRHLRGSQGVISPIVTQAFVEAIGIHSVQRECNQRCEMGGFFRRLKLGKMGGNIGGIEERLPGVCKIVGQKKPQCDCGFSLGHSLSTPNFKQPQALSLNRFEQGGTHFRYGASEFKLKFILVFSPIDLSLQYLSDTLV